MSNRLGVFLFWVFFFGSSSHGAPLVQPSSNEPPLQLSSEQSTGHNGAYSFVLDVPGYGSCPGHAATHGLTVAIFFANTDASTKDFGTGIALFKKSKGQVVIQEVLP